MLAFANTIFVLHRLIPFRYATHFATIIRAERRPHGPVGIGKNTEPCGSSHSRVRGSVRRRSAGAACQNYRPVQTCNARLDARFATASLPDHEADAALPGVRRCSRIFFGRIVNRSEKLPQKIKSIAKSARWIVIWCGRDLCCLIAPVNSREKHS